MIVGEKSYCEKCIEEKQRLSPEHGSPNDCFFCKKAIDNPFEMIQMENGQLVHRECPDPAASQQLKDLKKQWDARDDVRVVPYGGGGGGKYSGTGRKTGNPPDSPGKSYHSSRSY